MSATFARAFEWWVGDSIFAPSYEALRAWDEALKGCPHAAKFVDRWQGYMLDRDNETALTDAQQAFEVWMSKIIRRATQLIPMAKAAGIEYPNDAEAIEELRFDKNKYPHLAVFLGFQLQRPIVGGRSHWTNAEIIAKIPASLVRDVIEDDLIDGHGCV